MKCSFAIDDVVTGKLLFLVLVLLCNLTTPLGRLDNVFHFEVYVPQLKDMVRSCGELFYVEVDSFSSLIMFYIRMIECCTWRSAVRAVLRRAIVL